MSTNPHIPKEKDIKGLSPSLSEDVKMSIRSISSEITIFEIKPPINTQAGSNLSSTSPTLSLKASPMSTARSVPKVSQSQKVQKHPTNIHEQLQQLKKITSLPQGSHLNPTTTKAAGNSQISLTSISKDLLIQPVLSNAVPKVSEGDSTISAGEIKTQNTLSKTIIPGPGNPSLETKEKPTDLTPTTSRTLDEKTAKDLVKEKSPTEATKPNSKPAANIDIASAQQGIKRKLDTATLKEVAIENKEDSKIPTLKHPKVNEATPIDKVEEQVDNRRRSLRKRVKRIPDSDRQVTKETVPNSKAKTMPKTADSKKSVLTHSTQKNRMNEGTEGKTMKEVLASIPGFLAGRPKKRHNRKLSTAEQLELTKKDKCIDLETPGSVLAQVNLRAILNKHTFSFLPPLYQHKLLDLLPDVDTISSDSGRKLNPTALNNEFFSKACQQWVEKLNSGEFTPENRQRNKLEAEKERQKLDPWKVKHFEPIWGQKMLKSKPVPVPVPENSQSKPASTEVVPACSVEKESLVGDSEERMEENQNKEENDGEGDESPEDEDDEEESQDEDEFGDENDVDYEVDEESSSEEHIDEEEEFTSARTVGYKVINKPSISPGSTVKRPAAATIPNTEHTEPKKSKLALPTESSESLKENACVPTVSMPNIDTSQKSIDVQAQALPELSITVVSKAPIMPEIISKPSTEKESKDMDIEERIAPASDTKVAIQESIMPKEESKSNMLKNESQYNKAGSPIPSLNSSEIKVVVTSAPGSSVFDKPSLASSPVISSTKEIKESLATSNKLAEDTVKTDISKPPIGAMSSAVDVNSRIHSNSEVSKVSNDSSMKQVLTLPLSKEVKLELGAAPPSESSQPSVTYDLRLPSISSTLISSSTPDATVVKRETDSSIDVPPELKSILPPTVSLVPAALNKSSDFASSSHMNERRNVSLCKVTEAGSETKEIIKVSSSDLSIKPAVIPVTGTLNAVSTRTNDVATKKPEFTAPAFSSSYSLPINSDVNQLKHTKEEASLRIEPRSFSTTLTPGCSSVSSGSVSSSESLKVSSVVTSMQTSSISTTSSAITGATSEPKSNISVSTYNILLPNVTVQTTCGIKVTTGSGMGSTFLKSISSNAPISSGHVYSTVNKIQEILKSDNLVPTSSVTPTLANFKIIPNSSSKPCLLTTNSTNSTNTLVSAHINVTAPKPSFKPQSPIKTRVKPKQIKNRSGSANPPGHINLERSYQICEAVIKNSPNREQLKNQLVKPPPLLNKDQTGKTILTSSSLQPTTEAQKKGAIPSILRTPLQGTSVPILTSTGKVIVAQFAPGVSGTNLKGSHVVNLAQAAPGTIKSVGSSVVPVIRPVQPGSPLIVRAAGPSGPQILQAQQNQSTTIITPQQLAILLQQQHSQSPAPAAPQANNMQPQNRTQFQTVSLPLVNGSLSSNSSTGSVSYQPNTSSTSVSFSLSSTSRSSNNISSMPPVRIVQLPSSTTSSLLGAGNSSSVVARTNCRPVLKASNYPLRAQILTSCGETLTIHRASPVNTNLRVQQQPSQQQPSSNQQQQQAQATTVLPTASVILKSSTGGIFTMDQSKGTIQMSGNKSIAVKLQKDSGLKDKPQETSIRPLISMLQKDISVPSSTANLITSIGQGGAGGLADFITNQLAASNIGPISPYDDQGIQAPNDVEHCDAKPSKSSDICIATLSGNNSSSNQSSEGASTVEADSNSTCSSAPRSLLNNMNSNFTTGSPIAELINSTKEAIMDLQDAFTGSPYSLISDTEPPNIAEIIDVTTHETTPSNVSSTSWSPGTSLGDLMSTTKMPKLNNESSSGASTGNVVASAGAIPVPIGYNPMLAMSSQQSESNSNVSSSSVGFKDPKILSSNTLSTNNILTSNENSPSNSNLSPSLNLIARDPSQNSNPVIIQGGSNRMPVSSTAVAQQAQFSMISNAGIRQENGMNPPMNGTSVGVTNTGAGQDQGAGVRQQYIIVQTTGSDGLPTNIAVPTSLVISPQNHLMLNKGEDGKIRPRASSAPPIQGNNIMQATQSLTATSVSMPFCPQANPAQATFVQDTNQVSNNVAGERCTVQQQQVVSNNEVQMSSSKSLSLPTLEIQEGGSVRLIYSGQSGPGVQQIGSSQAQQVILNRNNSCSQLVPVASGSSDHVKTNNQKENVSFQTVVPNLTNISQNMNVGPVGISHSGNVVQVQVSQSPTIVHQQTINQVVNIGDHNTTNNCGERGVNQQVRTWSGSRGQILTLGENSNLVQCQRIVNNSSLNQPPVISIPDTTQNGDNSISNMIVGSNEMDILSPFDGVKVKLSGGNTSSTVSGSNLSSVSVGSNIRNGAVAVSMEQLQRQTAQCTSNSVSNGHQGLTVQNSVQSSTRGRLIVDSGGNCVCDLRAFVMCRKCGAFCHNDCIGPSDLCVSCMIR